MTDIVWGRAIEVNGVRPAWLGEAHGKFQNTPGEWLEGPPLRFWSWGTNDNKGRGCPISIKLPAEHFAYTALDRGFEPWGGGDAAPNDWDGGPVLWRNGEMTSDDDWKWGCTSGINDPSSSEHWDIIGYRKKAVAQPPVDTVTLPRMTIEEAHAKFGDDPDGTCEAVLRSLGLIREKTLVERYVDETGNISTAAIEHALNWAAQQK